MSDEKLAPDLMIERRYIGEGKWHSDGRIITGLTHWMSLPEGPK